MDTQNFNLNNFTRDQLYSTLSVARDEIAEYNRCGENTERCEKSIKDASWMANPAWLYIILIVL